MAKRDILPVFPSRANSVIMKQRVLAARRGVGLLKRKRDAIDMKMRELRRIRFDQDVVGDEMMRQAIFSMAKANLLGADFKPQMVSHSPVATAYLRRTEIKIVGVKLNCLELEKSGIGAFPLAGLSCGGMQVQRIRDCYTKALDALVSYASLEYQVRMLEAASLQTNMRVNALEHVVIPILQNTYNYICGELEEFEREDFYRLKRSQAKQLEAKMAFTELIKTKNMTDEELESYVKKNIGQARPVADTLFDDDAFDEREVKRRVREARLSLKQRRELAKKEASERGEPPPTTTYITTRSAMSVSGRLRDPRASSGDLYSTKRMILSDTKSIGSERKSISSERRPSQAVSGTSAKEYPAKTSARPSMEPAEEKKE
ncbi:probable V-type proton ATPase subunit D 2 [Drosophila subpulchrella]|uniref:probable V-type proton ATPase subunit D 2 n=1 Tax=Drosophila subpulchrella TaxID=1486046 RepID=UPI0018A1AB29|nr:probable V-type proton ATPase subunit D 2 [Drosophila subpulchrella]